MGTQEMDSFAVIAHPQSPKGVHPSEIGRTGEPEFVNLRVEQPLPPALRPLLMATVLSDAGNNPVLETRLASVFSVKGTIRIEEGTANFSPKRRSAWKADGNWGLSGSASGGLPATMGVETRIAPLAALIGRPLLKRIVARLPTDFQRLRAGIQSNRQALPLTPRMQALADLVEDVVPQNWAFITGSSDPTSWANWGVNCSSVTRVAIVRLRGTCLPAVFVNHDALSRFRKRSNHCMVIVSKLAGSTITLFCA